MARQRKHVPIPLDVGPGVTAVAHADPCMSLESRKALEQIAKAGAKVLRERIARESRRVCATPDCGFFALLKSEFCRLCCPVETAARRTRLEAKGWRFTK